jgi:hypothetical protein
MLIHGAATTFTTVINTAILWVQALTGATLFVLLVVCCCLMPLIAPKARGRAQQDRPEPQRRAPRRVPSWAHTEPYDYDEAA